MMMVVGEIFLVDVTTISCGEVSPTKLLHSICKYYVYGVRMCSICSGYVIWTLEPCQDECGPDIRPGYQAYTCYIFISV